MIRDTNEIQKLRDEVEHWKAATKRANLNNRSLVESLMTENATLKEEVESLSRTLKDMLEGALELERERDALREQVAGGDR